MRHRVASLAEIPDDRGHEVVLDGRLIGLFRHDGRIVAIDGLCPHAGGPMATGYTRDGIVMCPWHGWQFRLDTGCHATAPQIRVDTFEVTVEGDDVYLDLPDAAESDT